MATRASPSRKARSSGSECQERARDSPSSLTRPFPSKVPPLRGQARIGDRLFIEGRASKRWSSAESPATPELIRQCESELRVHRHWQSSAHLLAART